ncbi:MAG: orotidine-5'-phosphate decarboxylase [Deltaproteobacteria bacterium]|nr:orotidine-5'-phosphate decarboxylase [Deltaproteobacteria bacterium]
MTAPDKAHQRIIFPLDVPTKVEAVRFAKLLKDSVGVFKIGLELFVAEGPSVIEAVKATAPDAKIFFDMKLHDIPETVKRAMRSATKLGVNFITVHCDNASLMEAAHEAQSNDCIVLGVTVLTSLSREGLREVGISPELRDPSKLVMHRAELAKRAGLGGIVCSALEVASIKERFGSKLVTVTPGIRLADKKILNDDQRRVATPYAATKDGADYIVVGRPIRDAEDPLKAAEVIAKEIEEALTDKK